jgi:hypothetical protein|tara:strand:- start:1366 stop:2235 length:870 start_codon:yes stop_codon:yes gene_type:complete
MAHNNHTIDGINKDLLERTRDDYLETTKDWEDPYGIPEVVKHDGVFVVRDDKIVGSKCRFADLLVKNTKEDTIVYVQPRFGLAGVSILEVAKRYNKKVVLFMPSSKRISKHQAVCIEQGAIPKFHRIAAMPNLNRIAKNWAEETGAAFVPLGLKHPLVTACAVRVVENLREIHGDPDEVWCAISTGVLSRSLQIGWHKSSHHAVAVARNLKSGELGASSVASEPAAFTSSEKKENLPPFLTVPNYDGKVWKYIPKDGAKNRWMWNVGKEPVLQDETIYDKIDSYRDWKK